MKKIICISLLAILSNLAYSASDLSQLKQLNGRTGQGVNAYEPNSTFDCSIEIDSEYNTLSIIHPAAYYSTTLFMGNDVEKASRTSTEIVLTTSESSPSKSGLCGDYAKARKLQDTLVVTKNSVQIIRTYQCGLIGKTNKDVFSCNLK